MKRTGSLDLDGLDGITQVYDPSASSALLIKILAGLLVIAASAAVWVWFDSHQETSEAAPKASGIKPESLPETPAERTPSKESEKVRPVPATKTDEQQTMIADLALPTEPTAAGPSKAPMAPISLSMHFALNSIEPEPLSQKQVEDMVAMVGSCKTRIRVTGHTCDLGDEGFNQRLGLARAEAVKRLLISRGMEGQRIETASEGENQPAASNATPAGRAQNRRAELACLDRAAN